MPASQHRLRRRPSDPLSRGAPEKQFTPCRGASMAPDHPKQLRTSRVWPGGHDLTAHHPMRLRPWISAQSAFRELKDRRSRPSSKIDEGPDAMIRRGAGDAPAEPVVAARQVVKATGSRPARGGCIARAHGGGSGAIRGCRPGCRHRQGLFSSKRSSFLKGMMPQEPEPVGKTNCCVFLSGFYYILFLFRGLDADVRNREGPRKR